MSRSAQLVGMILVGLVGVLFLADLAAAVPFGRVSIEFDIGMTIASAIVMYLLWSLGPRSR